MSRHNVDAILVLSPDDGGPSRWMTRAGLARNAGRERSRPARGALVARLNADTSLAELRELARERDVSRVLIWCNSTPLAIVSAAELLAQTATALSGSPGAARLRRAREPSAGQNASPIAAHGRGLLGLIARAQADANGWTSEARLESMVPGGRLEWRVRALEVLTDAGLLERVQRDGQFDYRLTPKGLAFAEARVPARASVTRPPSARL